MKGYPKTITENLRAANYKFLDWANGWHGIDPPEVIKCRELGHKPDNVSHDNRGTEHTVSCDECKIYYKYDSSD